MDVSLCNRKASYQPLLTSVRKNRPLFYHLQVGPWRQVLPHHLLLAAQPRGEQVQLQQDLPVLIKTHCEPPLQEAHLHLQPQTVSSNHHFHLAPVLHLLQPLLLPPLFLYEQLQLQLLLFSQQLLKTYEDRRQKL